VNILIVSPGDINQPRNGRANREHNLAYYLGQFGNKIIVLEPADESNKRSTSSFTFFRYFGKIGKRSLCSFCDVNPFFILKFLTIIVNQEIDLVHVEFPWGVSSAKVLTTLLRKDIPVVYNSHNLQKNLQADLKKYFRESNRSSFADLFISTLQSHYTNMIEKLAVKLSDLVLCVSSDDASLFVNEYATPPSKLKVVPNGTNCQKINAAVRDRTKYGLAVPNTEVVFHGPYDYPPNTEAIALIENVIAPVVQKAHADVQFVIAGAGTAGRCTHPQIVCLGYVEDIYSLLKSCDIAIAPIISGGGTRLKILDYLGAGLPLIATKKGAEGIDLVSREHALIVNSVNNEFIDALDYLISNEKERKRIGKNGAVLAKEYDWQRIGYRLHRLYEGLTDTRGTNTPYGRL
jgi:glycosyltransferase involved in cell wall biosynthesis